jgi:hypothetical protein
MKKAYKILVQNPEEKILYGTHRCRWDDNTKMNLKEIRWEDMA